MWWTPAPSVEDLTEYEPAPLTTLTLRPSSRNVTFAIRRPLTVAFTVRPTQPEGPSSCDRPKTTFLPSTAPAGCTGGCAAAGAGGDGLPPGGGGFTPGGGGGVSSSQQKLTWLRP